MVILGGIKMVTLRARDIDRLHMSGEPTMSCQRAKILSSSKGVSLRILTKGLSG
jgi:hypothetical protein